MPYKYTLHNLRSGCYLVNILKNPSSRHYIRLCSYFFPSNFAAKIYLYHTITSSRYICTFPAATLLWRTFLRLTYSASEFYFTNTRFSFLGKRYFLCYHIFCRFFCPSWIYYLEKWEHGVSLCNKEERYKGLRKRLVQISQNNSWPKKVWEFKQLYNQANGINHIPKGIFLSGWVESNCRHLK